MLAESLLNHGLIALMYLIGTFIGIVILPMPVIPRSRMSYIIASCMVTLAYVLITLLYGYILGTYREVEPPAVLSLSYLFLPLAGGIAFGWLGLGRALDAGSGRGLAGLSLIPLINLAVMFKAPSPDVPRAPYAPKSPTIRFLFGALTVIVVFSYVDLSSSWMNDRKQAELEDQRTEALIDQRLLGEMMELNRALPRRVDSTTEMIRVDYDPAKRELTYAHRRSPVDKSPLTIAAARQRLLIRSQVCDELNALLAYGIRANYLYQGPDGSDIYQLIFTDTDC